MEQLASDDSLLEAEQAKLTDDASYLSELTNLRDKEEMGIAAKILRDLPDLKDIYDQNSIDKALSDKFSGQQQSGVRTRVLNIIFRAHDHLTKNGEKKIEINKVLSVIEQGAMNADGTIKLDGIQTIQHNPLDSYLTAERKQRINSYVNEHRDILLTHISAEELDGMWSSPRTLMDVIALTNDIQYATSGGESIRDLDNIIDDIWKTFEVTANADFGKMIDACACDAETGKKQLGKASIDVLTNSEMAASVDPMLLDQDEAIYFKEQLQKARDKGIDPFGIGGEPDEAFMQQLDAVARGESISSTSQVDTPQNTVITEETDLQEYHPGEMVLTSLWQPAEIIIDPLSNTHLLAIPDSQTGFPMSQALANDEEASSRILDESTITGMDFLTAHEKLLVFEAFNDAIRFGGDNAPSATLNLTDGINPVGGELKSYILLRKCLTTLKWGTIWEHDSLFKDKNTPATAISHQNEQFREEILGYTGSQGVFQRDALVERFQNFFRDNANETA